MSLFLLIAQFSFLLWTVRNILFWVYSWQVKEYRLDRMLVHLRETTQGRTLLFSYFPLLKWVVIFLYAVPVFFDRWLFLYQILITSVLFTESLFVIHEFVSQKLRIPKLTIRSGLTIFFSFFVILILFSLPLLDNFLWLLLLDRSSPFFVAFFIYALSVPSDFVKDIQIERATQAIKNKHGLIGIGVSGSYGKSSTKEYISQILSCKFKVLKTKDSNNTPIGVARTINRGLTSDVQIFIAEIGSYKKGEVREICQIINPEIGVSTGISYQHMSLFGDIQNILDTENELVESIPKNGLMLFNGNDYYTRKLYKRTQKMKIIYKSEKDKKNVDSFKHHNVLATNIKTQKHNISFAVWIGTKNVQFHAPLLGSHAIENILPGIYLGYYFGLTEKQIQNAVSHLKPPSKTMNPIRHSSGAMIVDDTFNTSPEAILAALLYMQIYAGNKILVFQPMIELGSKSAEEHVKIGKMIAETCDYLFLTNKNFYNQIRRAISSSDHPCKLYFLNPTETSKKIGLLLRHEDIVVFEGKEATITLNKLIKYV